MSLSNVVADVLPLITGVGGILSTIVVTKITSKKDISINDRIQLSKDEQEFRKELRETFTSYKEDLEKSRMEINSLREEMVKLKDANLELTLENKILQNKVETLTFELQSFKGVDK
jgi:predicted RNase H-like nuclease (RuvC/YqgF family)